MIVYHGNQYMLESRHVLLPVVFLLKMKQDYRFQTPNWKLERIMYVYLNQ